VAEQPPIAESTFRWDAGRTWYRVVGEPAPDGLAPLVVLHGGPGAAHDYMEPVAELARTTGRPCVFYDQIGCGRSQHLPAAPADFWTIELFRAELTALLDELELAGRYHLLGQSWGGMLALEYALTQPHGLCSMVLADSLASIQLWIDEANRLRSLLPADVQAVLAEHEAAGTTDSKGYKEAMMRFYERHVCRIPFPDCLVRSFAQLEGDPTVYHTMWGPSEFCVAGTLTDWDTTGRLGEISVPTLVISGEHDEATPAVVRPLVDGLSDARWELIEGASHTPHLEQPEHYLDLVESFFAAHD